jgi:hypothetical protein
MTIDPAAVYGAPLASNSPLFRYGLGAVPIRHPCQERQCNAQEMPTIRGRKGPSQHGVNGKAGSVFSQERLAVAKSESRNDNESRKRGTASSNTEDPMAGLRAQLLALGPRGTHTLSSLLPAGPAPRGGGQNLQQPQPLWRASGAWTSPPRPPGVRLLARVPGNACR